jgi:hypothetical protein
MIILKEMVGAIAFIGSGLFWLTIELSIKRK